MPKKFTVEVILSIEVTLDPAKFTPEFVEEYNNTIGYLGDVEDMDDLLRSHAREIAQQEARGVWRDDFAEGYGPPAKMGIIVEESQVVGMDIIDVSSV